MYQTIDKNSDSANIPVQPVVDSFRDIMDVKNENLFKCSVWRNAEPMKS